ncbi:MAG: PilZ domain-containing protein [Treponema sp.]|nr:PilZ domain-containing protein [Treponema sp.]
MGILTSQKISEYYARFKTIDVTFSKEIIQATGLITNQVYLKCVGDNWPCVVFSTSFQGAKLVVGLKSGILKKLEKANNMVSVRYCFKYAEKGNPVTFFVNARSAGYAPYGNSEDMAIFSLQFTQRPPDDLIEIMGRILDANVNSTKRRDDRIMISPESLRKLNITSKETAVFIQGVPRRCILRDISFSGAKIIMMGVAKFLVGKDAALRMDFDDPRQSFLMKGKFIRSEIVEGRKELVALALDFDESTVPMGYKIRINDYLSQFRVDSRTSSDFSDKKPAPPPPPKKAAPPPKTDWPSPEEAAAPSPITEEASPAAPEPVAAAPEPETDDDFILELS